MVWFSKVPRTTLGRSQVKLKTSILVGVPHEPHFKPFPADFLVKKLSCADPVVQSTHFSKYLLNTENRQTKLECHPDNTTSTSHGRVGHTGHLHSTKSHSGRTSSILPQPSLRPITDSGPDSDAEDPYESGDDVSGPILPNHLFLLLKTTMDNTSIISIREKLGPVEWWSPILESMERSSAVDKRIWIGSLQYSNRYPECSARPTSRKWNQTL